ncbi:uncharacterized protein EAE98_000610 [Botrytis deweyae]|uniref:Uncharacterized protein n=1 Tax=Botrytis deweyae TaxID=2478750 RepID=A0ABQ7J377_9HELO|nr:uncharacterized protein EAE98_000610 [Botrytis deweyae]KAF7940483.1 hypothetical protein EAE98_000610 [Botrytis deweyae]
MEVPVRTLRKLDDAKEDSRVFVIGLDWIGLQSGVDVRKYGWDPWVQKSSATRKDLTFTQTQALASRYSVSCMVHPSIGGRPSHASDR